MSGKPSSQAGKGDQLRPGANLKIFYQNAAVIFGERCVRCRKKQEQCTCEQAEKATKAETES